ncbi:MAG: hypothetical protein OEW29_08885 [Acidimicrobiia bacterium]|nr:hypothetical protein [Acidimicrobiia bacterium]
MVLESVIAFVIGLAVGLVLLALLVPVASKRMRARHEAAIHRYEAELAELRQERADDRETNRRLRRELAINTPLSLEATREERDRAIEELDKLSSELRHATTELADRDRSLREARLAIHDIRVQLEHDRFNRRIDDSEAEDIRVQLEHDRFNRRIDDSEAEDIRVQLEHDRFNRRIDDSEAEGGDGGPELAREAGDVLDDGTGSAIDNAVFALDDIVAGVDEASDQRPDPPVTMEPPAPPTPPALPQAEAATGPQATLVPPSILNSSGEVDGSDDDLEQPITFAPAPYADGSHEALEPALSESDVSSG